MQNIFLKPNNNLEDERAQAELVSYGLKFTVQKRVYVLMKESRITLYARAMFAKKGYRKWKFSTTFQNKSSGGMPLIVVIGIPCCWQHAISVRNSAVYKYKLGLK